MRELNFAKRTDNMGSSAVREILKLTQQGEIISFAGGLPSPESFPVEQLNTICQEVFAENPRAMLQYGTTEGHPPLRAWIAEWLQKDGVQVTAEHIQILSGSQQGIDLVSKALLNKGDQVVIECPSYLSAFQIFNAYEASYLPIESDEFGMDMGALEAALRDNNAKLIYTIPTFQNPSGKTMPLERRRKLIELANQYDVLVIEDDPYGWLRYEGERVPTLKSLDTEGRVVYLGSFSKIIAPGLRVGYAVAEPDLLRWLTIGKQTTDVHTSNLSQQIIYKFLEKGLLADHISKISSEYKVKCEAMLQAMARYFPKEATWTKAEGGLFLWVTLPAKINTKSLLEKAVAKGVAFVPGHPFYVNQDQFNDLRLNFSNATMEEIDRGIKTLAEVINNEL